MTEDTDTSVQEAQGELSLARLALADNDLSHAANHIAGAMAHAPQLPEVHELLAALDARCPGGGVRLYPLDGEAFIGAVVAHAHLLAARDPGAALGLLAQATAHEPAKPWADATWVRALPVGNLDPEVLTRALVTTMRSLGDPAPVQVRRSNDVYLDLARRAVAAHPDHAVLHGVAAGLARRFGDTKLAVRWGERAVALERSKVTSVWYAYALKADGRLDDALDVMRTAWAQNPLDLDLCADIATWLSGAGRLDEAIALIEEAMRIDPSYDCARHTAHRLRFLRDGDPQHLVALADFMRESPVSSHEHSDLADSCRGRPWLGVVAGPTEACINVLGQVPPEARTAGGGSLSLSALEVPSALAVLRREFRGAEVEIAGPPPPDMVRPQRPGRVLWRYDGMLAYPTVEPPPAPAAALLAGLAAPSWSHPVAAYDHALPLGELGVADLLSLLVHPPARPDGMRELPDGWWERSAQVFACLGLLHCRELDGAGDGGAARRRLLTEIAFGIEDWTTEAALFALTVAAWTDPSCRDEVRGVVGRRFLDAVQASRHRVVTIRESLAELVRIVPGMVPEVVSLADDVLAAARSGATGDGPEGGRGEPVGPPAAPDAPVSGPGRPSRLRRLFGRGDR